MVVRSLKRLAFRHGILRVALGIMMIWTMRQSKSGTGVCKRRHLQPDGGDCQAIGGPRRPSWACYSDMLAALPEFLELYKRRPFKENSGGMKLDHSFALYYILRQVKPSTVIETGRFCGFRRNRLEKASSES